MKIFIYVYPKRNMPKRKSGMYFPSVTKLALTSPTGGGRSVGIVRSRTKATEFSLVFTIFYAVEVIMASLKIQVLWDVALCP
jgi:hypothetical protein